MAETINSTWKKQYAQDAKSSDGLGPSPSSDTGAPPSIGDSKNWPGGTRKLIPSGGQMKRPSRPKTTYARSSKRMTTKR